MRNRRIIVVAATLIGIAIVAIGTFLFIEWKNRTPVISQMEGADTEMQTSDQSPGAGELCLDGDIYTYNSQIRNILFMGIDKQEAMVSEAYAGHGGQADCILLLSLNTRTKEAFALNISRDCMTDIDIYGISGDFIGTEKHQLALQYAYGDGERRSCWLMKKAVSNLLYDLPIHGYISLNLSGFSVINDVLGGVELTIPEDYTFIDPAFTAGVTLRLTGSQAERYVRYRDIEELGSNNGRMERQNQFLKALVGLLKEKTASNPDLVDVLYKAGKSYVATDLSVDEMKALSEYRLDDGYIKVPGETQAGENHDEYVVDEDGLVRLVADMFYTKKDKK